MTVIADTVPGSWLRLPDVRSWGSTAAERAQPFPCDRHLPRIDDVLHRSVTIAAEAAIVFRWLCQLRVAPYSYDWIDNFGRRSPRRLVPGLERLRVGERFMSVFRLVDFETDRHLTLLSAASPFGRWAVTYRILAAGPGHCRLVVRVLAAYPPVVRPVMQRLFPPGDWIMMRRQLLNLKELAEQTPA
jgi:hypothetical protein